MKIGLRRRVFLALENSPGGTLQQAVRTFLVGTILVATLSMILASLDQAAAWRPLLFAIDLFALIVFTVEYLARLWVAPEDRSGRFRAPVTGRLRYAVTPLALLDLAAILPFYLALVFDVDSLVVLRLFRLLWLIKLARFSPALESLGRVIMAERRAWGGALAIIAVLLTVSATLMWAVEGTAQPDAFGSIPAAMWWAIATVSTVGYGDVVPVTDGGRLLGAVVMLLGIATFGLPSLIVASGFLREFQRNSFAVTAGLIGRVPVFADLDSGRLSALADLAVPRVYPARFAFLRPGEVPEALTILAEGEMEIRSAGQEPVTLGPGDYLGVQSLLGQDDEQRRETRSVTTVTECRVLVIEPEDFRRFLEDAPALREKLVAEDGRHPA